MYLSKQLRNIIFAHIKHNPDLFKDFGETIYLYQKHDGSFHRERVVFLGVHKQDGLIPLMTPEHQLPRVDYVIECYNENNLPVTDEDSENILTLPECCALMVRDEDLSAVIAVVQSQKGIADEPVENWIIEHTIDCYADEPFSRDWTPGDEK